MARKDDEREKRLAAALRENLKRRKAQAREILPGTGRAGSDCPQQSEIDPGDRSAQL